MTNQLNSIQEFLGQTDIYLVDQIMKGRYVPSDKILEAGCGGGRNMNWFVKNNFQVYGIDQSEAAILNLRSKYPDLEEEKLKVGMIEKIPFEDNYFDHIISSAVLHFAKSETHFKDMMGEMLRVLKPEGSLFIRMTSDIGIEEKVVLLENGNYQIPDGSMRFLLTRNVLKDLMKTFPISFLEPLKTVNVDDMRCMSTLIFRKDKS
ncbi:MAG: class I SAM-dependent methyltransferase [Ginsengibacter sp.]